MKYYHPWYIENAKLTATINIMIQFNLKSLAFNAVS